MPDQAVAQAALDRAMEQPEDLLLVYQPIHDARTREILSAEALLRQRRSTGELREAGIITKTAELGPDLFLLDSLLTRKAYTDAAHWHARVAPQVRLNVNLSPREFQEGHVLDRLRGQLEVCGLDPSKVDLEITETSYIHAPEETVHVLEELRELGVRLWLDDFGTGHSSLTHLRHFPLAGLKLAGAFISGVIGDKRCRAIVRALIALAHELDMQVIAEEVETEAQLEFLLALDCDAIQGFLFSQPMPLADFERMLSDRSSGE